MKLGPCLRNSVVSPKTGQPIEPGGKSFLTYLISFHLNNIVLKRQTPRTATKTNMQNAMDARFSSLYSSKLEKSLATLYIFFFGTFVLIVGASESVHIYRRRGVLIVLKEKAPQPCTLQEERDHRL